MLCCIPLTRLAEDLVFSNYYALMYHLCTCSFVIIPGIIHHPSSAWFLTRISSLPQGYNRIMGLHRCRVWRLHSPPTRATFRQRGENDLRKSILGTTRKMNCEQSFAQRNEEKQHKGYDTRLHGWSREQMALILRTTYGRTRWTYGLSECSCEVRQLLITLAPIDGHKK